jgi:hypothetical protein
LRSTPFDQRAKVSIGIESPSILTDRLSKREKEIPRPAPLCCSHSTHYILGMSDKPEPVPAPRKLRLPWHLLFQVYRAEILAFGIAGALFVAFVLYVALVGPHFKRHLTGFNEPDWECTSLPQSEPVCVRRLDRPKQN